MKPSFPRFLALLALAALAQLAPAATAADAAPRERLRLDPGWKFHQGDEWGIGHKLDKSGSGRGPASTTFSDASWRTVDLPHDWAIELPFDPRADAAHGFRAIGEAFPENSVAWYRRTLDLPATDAGRRLWLELDGTFRAAAVFVNGWFAGQLDSGYGGARYDITDIVNCGGTNVIAVRVDATQPEGWFYEGAGLYRHVWLVKTAPVALKPDSVFVHSEFPGNRPGGAASVHVQAEVTNTNRRSTAVEVTWQISAPDGRVVAQTRQSLTLAAGASGEVGSVTPVTAPQLWSPENPRLYQLTTTVRSDGMLVDEQATPFGIRTAAFDPERGFLLNGEPYVIKGTCNHQDHAGVGAALPDRLQYFRIAKLKELGSNAYRTAHNPPTPELLEACDRLGMLVMDENRLLGSDARNLEWLENFVRRDRNHPSVVIWSLANEEFNTQASPAGARVAATMIQRLKELDPTRAVTVNANLGNVFEGVNSVVDVRGWSYQVGVDTMDAYHAAHPAQPNIGSEQGSTVGTRGIYHADPVKGYVTAYDDNGQSWSNTAKEWWSFFDRRPWLSGGFIWTGFDYRGEPTPYAWPCINSHFGVFDTCGFPKDNFWYYRSWWTPEPVLHLLPHWNWPGREGQLIDVRALSNCDEVELFLNGQSLGRKAMPHAAELKWEVAYTAGVLSAKGFRAGQRVAETRVETTAAAAKLQLTPDRSVVRADGQDLSVITVAVTDAEGRVVPTAGPALAFTVEGPGRIIGVGNGDPSCHEPDVFFATPEVNPIAITEWKWKSLPADSGDTPAEIGASFDDSTWSPISLEGEATILGVNERGVYRAQVNLTAAQLSASAIELWFGRIAGSGGVFVNGVKLAEAGDPRAPSVYEARSYLHPGSNTIAVNIRTWGAIGGLSHGVKRRTITPGPAPQWSRSAFNGLAQVIVQSTGQAGEIKLHATAAGLAAGQTAIDARSSTSGPVTP